MTRDEAIEIEFKTARAWPEFAGLQDYKIREAAGVAIDGYVALGMLKLDEPVSIRDKLVEMLGRKIWTASDVDEFRGCICAAGLKIVEK